MTTKFQVGDVVRLKMSEGADGRQALVGIAARVTVVDGLVYVLYDGKAGDDYAWKAERLEHVPRPLDATRWQAPCGCVVTVRGVEVTSDVEPERCVDFCKPGHMRGATDACREWLAQNTPKPEPEPREGDTWTSPTCGCVLRDCGEKRWLQVTEMSACRGRMSHPDTLRAERIAQLERPAGKPGDAHLPLKPCSACGVRLDDPYHDASHRERSNAAMRVDPMWSLDGRIASARWLASLERETEAAYEERMRRRFGRNWSGPSDPDEGGW